MSSFINTPFGSRLKEEELYRSIEALPLDISDAFFKSMRDVSRAGGDDFAQLWDHKIIVTLYPVLNGLLAEASAAWEAAKEREENAIY